MEFSLRANGKSEPARPLPRQRPVKETKLFIHQIKYYNNEHLLLQLASAAIYNLLGERSFGTDIGNLEVTNLSLADTDEIHQLEELPT
jgi:hypothetical protein